MAPVKLAMRIHDIELRLHDPGAKAGGRAHDEAVRVQVVVNESLHASPVIGLGIDEEFIPIPLCGESARADLFPSPCGHAELAKHL
jgi:hypothetical protein